MQVIVASVGGRSRHNKLLLIYDIFLTSVVVVWTRKLSWKYKIIKTVIKWSNRFKYFSFLFFHASFPPYLVPVICDRPQHPKLRPPPHPPFKVTNNDCSIMSMNRTHAPWLAFQARVGLDWLVQVGPWENLYVISLKYVWRVTFPGSLKIKKNHYITCL